MVEGIRRVAYILPFAPSAPARVVPSELYSSKSTCWYSEYSTRGNGTHPQNGLPENLKRPSSILQLDRRCGCWLPLSITLYCSHGHFFANEAKKQHRKATNNKNKNNNQPHDNDATATLAEFFTSSFSTEAATAALASEAFLASSSIIAAALASAWLLGFIRPSRSFGLGCLKIGD